jgi:hypothetical protein
MLIIIVVVVFALVVIREYLPLDAYKRLFELPSYKGGSDRDVLWKNAWELYSRDFLTMVFGAGWGTATVYTGLELAVHNTFLTMLCDVGIIGVALFIIPIVYMVFNLLKVKIILPVILLVSQFAPAFFIDAINKRFFWNALFILIIYYYYYVRHYKHSETVGEQV